MIEEKEENLKVWANVHDMKSRQVTTLEYKGKLFDIRGSKDKQNTLDKWFDTTKFVQTQSQINPQIESTPPQDIIKDMPIINKSERIDTFKGIPIYKNVVDAMKEALIVGMNTKQLKIVCYNSLPNMSKTTKETYYYKYTKYLREVLNISLPKSHDFLPRLDPAIVGKKIFGDKHNNYFQNVYNDISTSINNKQPKEAQMKILQIYHPKAKEVTLNQYLKEYIRYKLKEYIRYKQKVESGNKSIRGNIIAYIGTIPIYDKIYDEFEQTPTVDIFEKYYPTAARKSYTVYHSTYKRYHKADNNGTLGAIKTYRQVKPTKGIKYKPRGPYRKRHHKGGDDTIGFCKKYRTHIKITEYNKVRLAINKFGFVATSTSLMKETGLSLIRINAVLSYLRQKSQIYRVRKGHQVFYHPAIQGKEADL